MKLHELPEAHPARNKPIKTLNATIVCRYTKSKRDPSTWKIKDNTYNQLNDSWHNNFDWIVTDTK